MTPEQCWAAQAWLGLSQQQLAIRAQVAKNTVHLFEAGLRTPTPNNLAALRRAVEAEGLRSSMKLLVSPVRVCGLTSQTRRPSNGLEACQDRVDMNVFRARGIRL